MINVCISIHDPSGNYSKYAAVAVQSLINNTTETIRFFILHDDTIGDQQKNKLEKMIKKKGNTADFIMVEIPEEWSRIKALKAFTVGTLFRLLIPNILPKDVKKVIYIDADTLTNLDIKELWDMDMDGAIVCGRKEAHYDNPLFAEGVSEDTYVNAGVLLLNLEGIKEYCDFYSESVAFFEKHPNCMWNDEDALNYILNKKQRVFSERYNTFTVLENESKPERLFQCIYHFAGDHPRANGERAFDREFFRILRQTPWGKDDNDMLEYFFNQIRFREKLYGIIRQVAFSMGRKRQIVFWGAKETKEYKKIKEVYDLSDKDIRIVDSNPDNNGNLFDNMRVEDPKILSKLSKDALVIILAYNHYEAIGRDLVSMGYKENDGFVDSRLLLSEPEGGRHYL